MTFAVGHVAGGTNAGWKRQKPTPTPWGCSCAESNVCNTARCAGIGADGMCPFGYGTSCETLWKVQPAYMSRCTDCGQERP